MTGKRGTNAERLEWLRKWGGRKDHVRYVVDHHRLRNLHPIDKAYFEEDVAEIIDIAFERGIYAERERARTEFEFLTSVPPSELPQ